MFIYIYIGIKLYILYYHDNIILEKNDYVKVLGSSFE